MGTGNFTDDFKRDAVAQITERGYPVKEVCEQTFSLCVEAQVCEVTVRRQREGRRDPPAEARAAACHGGAGYPKKGDRVFRQGCKVRYAFVAEHRGLFSVRAMCRCLRVQPSGFYAWLKALLSRRGYGGSAPDCDAARSVGGKRQGLRTPETA